MQKAENKRQNGRAGGASPYEGNGDSTQTTVGVGALDDPCAENECFAFKILRWRSIRQRRI